MTISQTAQPVFFHGTRTGFSRGGYVTPQDFHKRLEQTVAPLAPGRSRDVSSSHYTYLTTSRQLAWAYAWCGPGRGRPKVLTVQPMGGIERDPEHSLEMEAYRCDGWLRVLHVDTEPLMTEAEAWAGWVMIDG